MKTLFFAFILFSVNQLFGQEFPVEFEINNLKNFNGSVIVSVYNNPKSFDDGIPWKQKVISKKANLKDGTFKAQFLLPPGEYGLVFVDDENDDGEMTNNFIGLPKEGFGFSNFYLSGFKKPKFADFSFTHNEDSEILRVRLRYF